MRIKNIVLMVACALISTNACAQKMNEEADAVKSTLLKMFEIVEAGKSMQLADYIVYRGSDKERKWNDYCHYDNPEEKHQVQNIHQRIVDRYLPYEYKFVKFFTETESEGEWLIWETSFDIEGKPKPVYFAFLKINGQYLLGDID